MMHKYNSPDNDCFMRVAERIQEFIGTAKETLGRKGSDGRHLSALVRNITD